MAYALQDTTMRSGKTVLLVEAGFRNLEKDIGKNHGIGKDALRLEVGSDDYP